MPPRYAYWTILIDQQPTAFRAKAPEDLLPTLHQLRRTNRDVVMKWFARGRLWESPDAERAARQKPRQEARGPDWRPGGLHKDPRARFDKRKLKDRRPVRDRKPAGGAPPFKPVLRSSKPSGPPGASHDERFRGRAPRSGSAPTRRDRRR